MSAALHGNLRDFGMGEVLQLIGQQQKTGVLEVAEGGERIRVVFDGGAVVSGERAGDYPEAALLTMLVRTGLITPERQAELEVAAQSGASPVRTLLENGELAPDQVDDVLDLVTRDTIFALLRWTKGSFHFTTQRVAHGRDSSRLLAAEQILMDGMRMVDEWRTFDDAARRDDTVFRRCGRFEAWRDAHPGEPPERLALVERVFLMLDGRMSVRRVTDLARLGDFEGARLLTALRRTGLIEPVDPATLPRRGRARIALELGRGPSLLGAGLAVLPFLLLAGVLGALLLRPPVSVPETPGSRLEGPLPREAMQAFERRRLRHGAEAYRFAFGAWPADVAAVEGALGSWPGRPAMAPPGGGQYYYARRAESFVLLAPDE